jgi:hypothetical protein
MNALESLSSQIGLAPACAALQIHRSAIYRERARCRRLTEVAKPSRQRPRPPLAFSARLFSRPASVSFTQKEARELANLLD